MTSRSRVRLWDHPNRDVPRCYCLVVVRLDERGGCLNIRGTGEMFFNTHLPNSKNPQEDEGWIPA